MNAIENQVFTWKDWQYDDTATFSFYEAELIVPVGPYPIGTKFAFVSWNGDNSTLSCYETLNQFEPSFVGRLKVTVE